MSLGTAIILAFIVLILIVVGLIVLVIWLFCVGKRNPNAPKVYHILALFPALIIIGYFVYLFLFLPAPLSEKYSGLRDTKPFAVLGQRVYMLAQDDSFSGWLLGYFDLQTREFKTLRQYNEGTFSTELHSLAWDGKQLAISFETDSNYLAVIENNSITHQESFDHEIFISRDPSTSGFKLAIGTNSDEQLMLRDYDRNFQILKTDTFLIPDQDLDDMTFGPRSIQYIGQNWYANSNEKTYQIEVHGDTLRFLPLGSGGVELLSLYGGLTPYGSYRWLLTPKGQTSTSLPESHQHFSVFNQEIYYRLYPDSMSWRFLLRGRTEREAIDNLLYESGIKFRETTEPDGHELKYEVTYPGTDPVKMKVLHKYASISYSQEMVFVSKDTLDVEYHDFSRYAIFNTVNGNRLDSENRSSVTEELIRDDFTVGASWIALGFSLFWIAVMIFSFRKKSERILNIPVYIFSLIQFFLVGLPYLVLLTFMFLD